MWVLVLWVKQRSISILKETDEMIEIEEVLDLYYNGKKYEAVLKIRSGKI